MAGRDVGVTYRGSVDAWECDQMEHMNVRFFGRRFSEAEQHAFAALGLPSTTRSSHDVLRFRREVRRGAALRIETKQVERETALIHELYEDKADQPSATLEADYRPFEPDMWIGDADGWIECGRGLVHHADCIDDAIGREGLLRLVNQSNIYFGIGRHRAQHPDGRLAVGTAIVACSLRRHAGAVAGTPFVVDSRLGAEGHKSFRLLHCMRHATEGTVFARCEATIVFFDIATRHAIPLPVRFRDEFPTTKELRDE